MGSEGSGTGRSVSGGSLFSTTHWSMIRAAGDPTSPQSTTALEELCRTYWYPVYVYVRGSGYRATDAQDLTQAFFARLLEKNYLSAVQEKRGRFRWFLLCAVKRFLLNEVHRGAALKRGGGVAHVEFDGERAEARYRLDAADSNSPDKLFDRAWAIHLIETVYRQIEEEYRFEGKSTLLESLQLFLAGDRVDATYVEAGAALGMSEGAFKVAVHRVRRRYRDLLREQVARTVHSPGDMEEELRSLHAAFAPGM